MQVKRLKGFEWNIGPPTFLNFLSVAIFLIKCRRAKLSMHISRLSTAQTVLIEAERIVAAMTVELKLAGLVIYLFLAMRALTLFESANDVLHAGGSTYYCF